MKIAVTGHEGRIGSELVRRGYEPLVCDITDFDQTKDAIHSVSPDVIIHCAAATDVGWCEENDKEAFGINVRGTTNLLEAFTGTFIYLSTVHVFNGQKFFKYSEKHQPSPINVYGLTKWSGEVAGKFFADNSRFIVVRTSRTFDWGFIRGGIEYLKRNMEQDYTTLIKRSFVHTSHFVDGLTWLVDRLDEFPDLELLHLAGTDMFSYYEFWLQVANILGYDNKLIIPRKHKIKDHPRPFKGGLNVDKAKKMGVPLFSSIDGLKLIKDKV